MKTKERKGNEKEKMKHEGCELTNEREREKDRGD